MKRYLLDNSVLVEGLFGSKVGLRQFIRLNKLAGAKKVELYSTPLLFYEFNNVIRFRLDSLSADHLFKHLLSFNVKILELRREDFDLARNLAYETNTTFYDASYHTLALSRDMIFLTMDKGYFRQSKEKGSIELFDKARF